MTTKFFELLNNNKLYPKEVLVNFGINDPHWRNSSDRERELSLRHDMVCILLCNLQLNPIKETLERIGNKRKASDHLDEEPAAKRILLGHPSTSSSTAGSNSTGSTSTTVSREEDEELGLDPEQKYRF